MRQGTSSVWPQKERLPTARQMDKRRYLSAVLVFSQQQACVVTRKRLARARGMEKMAPLGCSGAQSRAGVGSQGKGLPRARGRYEK